MSNVTTENFNPARTIPEASARMFALAAAPDAGTRGPKRSLVALAQSLGLDVDLAAVNAVLGAQIADSLGTGWVDGVDYEGLQVTLIGMNNLLRAASASIIRLSREQSVSSTSVAEVLLAFPAFSPAPDKQSAVNRLCDIAGVPHDALGPGGKEHTWTLRDVSRRLAPHLLDRKRTKHELAAALCEEFGVPWLDGAGSTGASITRDGLNLLLAGAERAAHVSSAGWATAAEEGTALVGALADELPDHWDGVDCIRWMREAGSTQWRQMEWFGFYFEERLRDVLNSRYPTPIVGGPRVRYGSTIFDYASPTRVWDAKAHTALTREHPWDGTAPSKRSSSEMWLNDAKAVRACVEEQGLGFIIVDGLAGLDSSGDFRAWHKAFSESDGRALRRYVASTGRSRARKAVWSPIELRAIWIEDTADLDAGIAAGWLAQKGQPDWGAGTARRARNDKFSGRPARARPWQVASHTWLGARRGADL
ncbi:hypothetical protein [Isoptericola cucumis]|uniref:hypothetical protein n=1 Tax=Isoptericola cucumis TaxID=1776856 RepID=UPI00166DEB05|nr:hypothetical protein [Isoptericola cucumis]